MTAMIELPAEIWLHVLQYLDDELVRGRGYRLHEVSSVFLQVALDRRYRALKVTDITPRSILRIRRLADPAIARRVRSLTLAPHLGRARGMPAVGHGAAMSIFGLVGGFLGQAAPSGQQLATIMNEWLEIVVRLLPLLSSLDTFGLETNMLDAQIDIQPLTSCVWQSPCIRVTELRLSSNVEGYVSLFKTSPRMPVLERLRLGFLGSERPNPDDAHALVTCIAPFVNRHAGRLQVLRVSFFTLLHQLDMAPFFDALGPFPSLHTCAFHARFADTMLSKPDGLVRLLCTPSLRTVQLCASSGPGSRRTWAANEITEAQLADFICCLADEESALRSVDTLDICPAMSPAGMSALRRLLARLAPTLSTLRVREHHFMAEEMKMLVGAVPALNELAVCVRALTIDLFDVLPVAFPGLKKLILQVENAVSSPATRVSMSPARLSGAC
ncbi:hypothetical protein BD626DRAFT_491705 [Schizophyllum amplum]|uniref:F-box domain-containing protein n=1 Tax=Schizophyllum amplum TaxID=97359 RepID=A0A550CI23_9AGAR|nr:hypothetical protein BD626DRAFT_491705 [Auriculariopsis ampla]